MVKDGRQYGRVKPVQRIRGMLGSVPVVVSEVSIGDIGILHQQPLADGRQARLVFDWEGSRATLECIVRRTIVEREARTAFEKPLYHTGLTIVSADRNSHSVLRAIVEDCVVRALDEQKANARGIPATAAQSFQTGKADEFLRCELLPNGQWRKTRTKTSEQPLHGFTISVDEAEEKVTMLCSAYERGDAEGRKLIRTFAALSISKAEGIPTRRYLP